MGCPGFSLSQFLGLLAVQAALGTAAETCPIGPPGLTSSPPGWAMSDFLYMVYDQVQPDNKSITTSHVGFNIMGGFSNQTFHCEVTTPSSLRNGTDTTGSIWAICATNSTTEYTVSTQYKPATWNLVTLRETIACRGESTQLRTVLFKVVVASNNFVADAEPLPSLPVNATNLQTWTRTYYPTYSFYGSSYLLPPPPQFDCPTLSTNTVSRWEITNFSFNASCFDCFTPPVFPPTPWTISYPGYETRFHLVNRMTGYEVDCYHLATDYIPPVIADWWATCGWDPDDAPYMPVTWFRMDREAHMLRFNQSWDCDAGRDGVKVRYEGRGELYVPWGCGAGPGNYTRDGCKVAMSGVAVEGTVSRKAG